MAEERQFHNLLARQLTRCYGSTQGIPADAEKLVSLVDAAYREFDAQRELSERSMQIASKELVEQNQQLTRNNAALKEIHDQLREQTVVSETLCQIGQTIAAELDLQKVIQAVTDQATQATGAQFGAFFYSEPTASSPKYRLQVISGLTPEQVDLAGGTAANQLCTSIFSSHGVFRCGDIDMFVRQDEQDCPRGLPEARSAMAAAVVSRTGQVLGGLFFGHDRPDMFGERDQRLLQGIASHAAIAIDNAQLFKSAQEAGDRLAHQAQHDALTGLPNRVLFRDRVQRCIERSRRREDYCFAILFMDLDRFKIVNDSLGHSAGDRLLVKVAERLGACLRSSDSIARTSVEVTMARMGGDEFTILLDDLREPDDANIVAQRIIETLGAPYEIDGHELRVGASVGIAHSAKRYSSSDELLRDADAAMYHAKAGGKGRYAVFDTVIHNNVVQRLRMDADLRRALDRTQFHLVYQPIVCLSTRRCVGFEALVRWVRDGRVVGPTEFVPLAEDVGLIVPIGRWVFGEACRQLKQWQTSHPSLSELTMSVNLSRKQLPDPNLMQYIGNVLAETQLDPALLKLEITEGMLMENIELSREVLARLGGMGIGIQMDDFGTGYSSLSCLSRLPLDGLKLDRSFVADLVARRDCVAVLQAMMTLAHNLRMKVVAEGLELPEQVVLLQALDCDYGQGYFFAKPLPPEDALQFALTPPTIAQAA